MTAIRPEAVMAASTLGVVILFFAGMWVVFGPAKEGSAPAPLAMPSDVQYPYPQVAYQPQSPRASPCSGTERLCAVITTATPRETLRKLIDTMPLDDPDQLHSVTLSVVWAYEPFLLPSAPPQAPKEPRHEQTHP